jgi:hypothetical protein
MPAAAPKPAVKHASRSPQRPPTSRPIALPTAKPIMEPPINAAHAIGDVVPSAQTVPAQIELNQLVFDGAGSVVDSTYVGLPKVPTPVIMPPYQGQEIVAALAQGSYFNDQVAQRVTQHRRNGHAETGALDLLLDIAALTQILAEQLKLVRDART